MNQSGGQKMIRVSFQQLNLPKYRVPMYKELARRPGITIHVYHSPGGPVPNMEADGFEASVVPLRSIWKSLVWHSPQLSLANRRTTDVLVLWWGLHFVSLVPGLLLARLRGVPTILWGHGYSKNERTWRRTLRNLVGRMADAVMVYTPTTARKLVEQGFPSDRVYYALNSLDQEPIQEARKHWLARPDELSAFKEQHGLNEGPVLLFVSRFDRDNRIDVLIRAAERLRATRPGLKAVIVGKGEDEPRLKELTNELGMTDSVVFPGAIYDEMELAPWFLSADVFCYPANVGLSLMHAFGYGLPVVTSDRIESQNPEIEALEDGVNGALYPHCDAEALAKTLARLIDDPALARRMGEAGLESVLTRYNIPTMVDGMEGAIRHVVRSS